MRKILTFPNPILGKRAKALREVTAEVRKLISEMIEIMHAADPKGIGLAAPQVGVLFQIIVVDIGESPIALINPKILARKGKDTDKEGCLSLPGIYAEVERSSWVKIAALNREGKTVEIEAESLLSRVLQHEIDHLKGILFIDRIKNWETLELAEGYSIPEKLLRRIEAHASTRNS